MSTSLAETLIRTGDADTARSLLIASRALNAADADKFIADIQAKMAAPATATVAEPPVAFDPLPLVPAFLKSLSNWVTFQSKDNKAPIISGTRDNAKSNDPTTWVSYHTACGNIAAGKGYRNLGFVTDGANSGNLVGFDFDGCRNPETGELTEWAVRMIEALGATYGEITISGTGLRLWVIAPLGTNMKFKMGLAPLHYGKNQVLEIFGDGLYFTMSGNRLPGLPSEIRTLNEAQMGEVLAVAHRLAVENPKPKKVQVDGTIGSGMSLVSEPDEGFRQLFDEVGWQPLIDRMNKMGDDRFHNLVIDAGKMTYCPMPGHTPRSTNMKYTPCFGALATEPAIAHCFGCDFSGDMVKAVSEFDRGEDGGKIDYKNMYDCARAICKEYSLNFDDYFPPQVAPTPSVAPSPEPQITEEQVSAAEGATGDEEYPVILLGDYAGPAWDDDWMYGIAGEITRKAAEYCEAHPAGMYLDFLISIGNIFGRGAYFNTNSTRHYTNEFMVRVGDTATARKGTGRDAVDEPLKQVDWDWFTSHVMSGFGSGEAIVHQIADASRHTIPDKKTPGGFKTIIKPGVDDKRLCVREGEAASVMVLAGKKESRADIVIRDGWDGKPLKNIVKGNTAGINNSAQCMEPHISISGDTTRNELLRKMPDGADQNGFGNRFLWCYVHRVKLCPLGGPLINWDDEVARLQKIIAFAKAVGYVPLSRAAAKVWMRMYVQMEQELVQLPALTQAMCSRGVAHVRRLALILAVLDMSTEVETKHLHAAKLLWDYCQESARFIFEGTTKDQERIAGWVARQQRPVTVREVVDEVFHRNVKVGWVKSQMDGLVNGNRLTAAAGAEPGMELYAVRQ